MAYLWNICLSGWYLYFIFCHYLFTYFISCLSLSLSFLSLPLSYVRDCVCFDTLVECTLIWDWISKNSTEEKKHTHTHRTHCFRSQFIQQFLHFHSIFICFFRNLVGDYAKYYIHISLQIHVKKRARTRTRTQQKRSDILFSFLCCYSMKPKIPFRMPNVWFENSLFIFRTRWKIEFEISFNEIAHQYKANEANGQNIKQKRSLNYYKM